MLHELKEANPNHSVFFIGVGEMGRPMVRNLVDAGYYVAVCDRNVQTRGYFNELGLPTFEKVPSRLPKNMTVCLSLPSSELTIQVIEYELIPRLQPGAIVIDFGTTTIPETRRLARILSSRNISLLDAPVSGGPIGVEEKELRVFVGGSQQAYQQTHALMAAVAGDKYINYCGPSGAGQAVKGSNQLMMGVVTAAYLEAASFAIREGVDPHVLLRAVGGNGWLREDFSGFLTQILNGGGEDITVKFRELPYFIAANSSLPLTEQLVSVLSSAECTTYEGKWPVPSYWKELIRNCSGNTGPSECA